MEPSNCDSKFLNLCRKSGTPIRIVTNLPDPDSGAPLHIIAKLDSFNSEHLLLQDLDNPKSVSLLSRNFVGLVSVDLPDG